MRSKPAPTGGPSLESAAGRRPLRDEAIHARQNPRPFRRDPPAVGAEPAGAADLHGVVHPRFPAGARARRMSPVRSPRRRLRRRRAAYVAAMLISLGIWAAAIVWL